MVGRVGNLQCSSSPIIIIAMLKQQSQYSNNRQPIPPTSSLQSTLEQSPTRETEAIDKTGPVCRGNRKSMIVEKQFQRNQSNTKQKQKEETKWCVLHNKELQIFCMTDRVRVCPHCALFSIHRQHQLRPAKEIAELVRSLVEQFKQCSERKVKLDDKLKSRSFRQAMIATITAHKDSLIAQIKHKFKEMQSNIQLAEKRAFDEVAKSFKSITKQITAIDKQQQHSNLLYQKWELACQHLLQTTNFEQKAYLYAAGNLNLLQEGRSIIEAMEQKADSKIDSVERIVKSIKVHQNQAVANSIFNYLNVAVEEQLLKTSESLQVPKQEEIVQFSSLKILREPTSPLSQSSKGGSCQKNEGWNGRKSNNRRPSKLQLVTAIQLESVIVQFCNRQNLETLDLSNCGLLDAEIVQLLDFIKTKKKIKSLKLSKNKLTSQGFGKIIPLIPVVTNLNLSSNHLSEESLYELLRKRPNVPHLRIVNLSSNTINERRCQTAIEQLKKQGVIVTI